MFPSEKDLRVREERVRAAFEDVKNGRLSRREFLRWASVMGAGTLAAALVSSCGGTPEPTATPKIVEVTKVVEKPVTQVVEKPVTQIVQVTPTIPPTPVGGVTRGGKLVSNYNYTTERFTDPALITTTFHANVIRQVCDWLVKIGPDMKLKPALATEWTPSADGLKWTIKLRKGVKFNHGKPFTADDVVFTFKRLLSTETASAFKSVANYLKPDAVQKVDDFTVVFNCERAVADFPYHLHDYHAAILPADWTGDFYKSPWGTGPFVIEDYRPGERITYKRRDDYWDMGVDGKPLPYLDQLEFRSYPDQTSWLDALGKGELHLNAFDVSTMPFIIKLDATVRAVIWQTGNFWNGVLRCDSKPFNDPKVRKAFKLAMDRQTYITNALMNYGIVAWDQPISPLYELAPTLAGFKRDVEQAKKLLAEAGYPNGMDLKLQFFNDTGHTNICQWMQNSAAAAGFRITLAPLPTYYQTWLKPWDPFVMGADNWAMRATPSEFFNIAYRSNGDWNEYHWSNEQFDKLLAQSDAELDPTKRKAQYQQMCQIVSDDGGVVVPAYRQDMVAANRMVQGFAPSPIVADYYAAVWLKK